MDDSTDNTVSERDEKQRDSKGRFAKGNTLARGCPDVSGARAYKRAIQAAVTPEQIVALVQKMLVLGLQGDTAAAKIVLERVMGKPDQKIEVETTDVSRELEERVAELSDEQLRILTGLSQN